MSAPAESRRREARGAADVGPPEEVDCFAGLAPGMPRPAVEETAAIHQHMDIPIEQLPDFPDANLSY